MCHVAANNIELLDSMYPRSLGISLGSNQLKVSDRRIVVESMAGVEFFSFSVLDLVLLEFIVLSSSIYTGSSFLHIILKGKLG